jgi:hypothetical protein
MGSAEPEVPFNLDKESLEELADSTLQNDWNQAGRLCRRAWQLNVHQDEKVECFAKVRQVVEMAARNPRTRVEAAVHLIDLAKNKTRQAA